MAVSLAFDAEGLLCISGTLAGSEVTWLRAQVMALLPESGQGFSLELAELELTDAVAMIGMQELLRQLVRIVAPVWVYHPPQLLAHSLYRTGDLSHPGLRLIEPREEEPYG